MIARYSARCRHLYLTDLPSITTIVNNINLTLTSYILVVESNTKIDNNIKFKNESRINNIVITK